MGKAIPFAIREVLVHRRQSGEQLSELAMELGISYAVACKIWRNFKKEGQTALVTHYSNCGRKPLYEESLKYRIIGYRLNEGACRLGAPYIRSKLLATGHFGSFPHERTIQRWFRDAGVHRPVGRGPKKEQHYSVEVHQTWQVDAKENLVLGNEQPACYLSSSDEASGTFLQGKVFPPGQD